MGIFNKTEKNIQIIINLIRQSRAVIYGKDENGYKQSERDLYQAMGLSEAAVRIYNLGLGEWRPDLVQPRVSQVNDDFLPAIEALLTRLGELKSSRQGTIPVAKGTEPGRPVQ